MCVSLCITTCPITSVHLPVYLHMHPFFLDVRDAHMGRSVVRTREATTGGLARLMELAGEAPMCLAA